MRGNTADLAATLGPCHGERMKFLEELDPQVSDDVLAAIMLRANARVGIAATAGGGFGSIAGTLARAEPMSAKLVGVVVAFTLMVIVGGLFVSVARSTPPGLVGNFAKRVKRARESGKPMRMVAEGGATAIGALTFVVAFAILLAS